MSGIPVEHGMHLGIVVSHTHWDREWYEPFDVFLVRLTSVLDEAMDLLQDDLRFRSFMLDGQTAMLEDYLTVRPDRESLVRQLVQEGRLLVGPWYVLADEFLVSAESLVRNLMIGLRSARRFGSPMMVGYVPDAFGHCSQLPMILVGFGIDTAVFTRGMGGQGDSLACEFWWDAGDGSRVLAVRQHGGYGNFAAIGHRDRDGRGLGRSPDLDDALARTLALLEELGQASAAPVLLLGNGSDHLRVQRELPEMLSFLNGRLRGVRLVHGSLTEYVSYLKACLGQAGGGGILDSDAGVHIGRYEGELRGARFENLLPGVLSARMDLKLANEEAQILLERYAEPLVAMTRLFGLPSCHPALLTAAWKKLLLNHAHDSICGCSVDAVCKDMTARFDQVMRMGREITTTSLETLGRAAQPQYESVVVFNSLNWERSGTVVAAGERASGASGRSQAVEFVAAAVPACGYAVYEVPATPEGGRTGEEDRVRAEDVAVGQGWLENEFIRVEVEQDGGVALLDKPTGCWYRGLNVLEDTADAGDEYDFSPLAGDACLTCLSTRGCVWTPAPAGGGPIARPAWLEASCEWQLPEGLSDDRSFRSAATRPVSIVTRLGLSPGKRRLDVTTRVTNRCKDHRLRVRFPTGISTDFVWADSQFDVVKRPVASEGGAGWVHPPSPTSPQRSFVAVESAEGRGLAVISHGIPEYEASYDKVDPSSRCDAAGNGVVVRLTLLRCVGWLSRNDLRTRAGSAGPIVRAPGAQCLQEFRYRYAVRPFSKGWASDKVWADALDHNVPLLAVVLEPAGAASVSSACGSGAAGRGLPSRFSLLKTSTRDEAGRTRVVVSCLKPTQDPDRQGVVVRLHNPGRATARERVWLAITPGSCYLTDLDERPVQPLNPVVVSTGGDYCCYLDLDLPPASVRTIWIG